MICNKCFYEGFDRQLFTKKSDTLCKECDKKMSKIRRRTKKGLVSGIYSHQKRNSIKRGHNAPTYTMLELREWLFSQKIFHELYDYWVTSNFNKKLTPSCDRVRCREGYSLYNLQLITWAENHKKATYEIQSGMVGPKSKKINQYTLDGVFIRTFKSVRSITKEHGYDNGFIIKVCKGKYKTAYGFVWRYSNG